MPPETVEEKVTRTRRARGLSDRIDDALIERVAAMVRSTPTRPPARRMQTPTRAGETPDVEEAV